jgi:hypothetical protein
MKYFIDLNDDNNQATVYTQTSRPEGVAHLVAMGATPTDAIRRLMAERYRCKIVVWSDEAVNRGVWDVRYSLK